MTKWKKIQKGDDGKYHGIVYRYCIIDTVSRLTTYSYIGQTANEAKRRYDWKMAAVYGGPKVNAARKKYGHSAFSYEVLKSVEAETLEQLAVEMDKWEMFYIKFFDAVKHGFNGSYGNGNKGMTLSPEHRRKIGEGHEKVKTLVTELATGETTEYSSATKAATALGLRASDVYYWMGRGEHDGYKFDLVA